MVKGLRRFFQAPLSKKLFFLKTLCVSFLVRFLIFGLPFRWVKHLLNLNLCPPETIEPRYEMVKTGAGRTVLNMINTVHRYFPWKNTCLVQAITGKILLKQRAVKCIIVMGLKKDGTETLKAHAWLVNTEGVITGFDEKQEFTEVAYLS